MNYKISSVYDGREVINQQILNHIRSYIKENKLEEEHYYVNSNGLIGNYVFENPEMTLKEAYEKHMEIVEIDREYNKCLEVAIGGNDSKYELNYHLYLHQEKYCDIHDNILENKKAQLYKESALLLQHNLEAFADVNKVIQKTLNSFTYTYEHTKIKYHAELTKKYLNGFLAGFAELKKYGVKAYKNNLDYLIEASEKKKNDYFFHNIKNSLTIVSIACMEMYVNLKMNYSLNNEYDEIKGVEDFDYNNSLAKKRYDAFVDVIKTFNPMFLLNDKNQGEHNDSVEYAAKSLIVYEELVDLAFNSGYYQELLLSKNIDKPIEKKIRKILSEEVLRNEPKESIVLNIKDNTVTITVNNLALLNQLQKHRSYATIDTFLTKLIDAMREASFEVELDKKTNFINIFKEKLVKNVIANFTFNEQKYGLENQKIIKDFSLCIKENLLDFICEITKLKNNQSFTSGNIVSPEEETLLKIIKKTISELREIELMKKINSSDFQRDEVLEKTNLKRRKL